MAVYHFSAKTVSRSAGHSSTAAAAYRAAERIVDERTGEIHDYTRKGGVVASEVILPGGGTMERAALWNKVEAHHKRGDATVAREFVVAHGYDDDAMTGLAEMVMRVWLSFLQYPANPPRSDDDLREFIRTWVCPCHPAARTAGIEPSLGDG